MIFNQRIAHLIANEILKTYIENGVLFLTDDKNSIVNVVEDSIREYTNIISDLSQQN